MSEQKLGELRVVLVKHLLDYSIAYLPCLVSQKKPQCIKNLATTLDLPKNNWNSMIEFIMLKSQKLDPESMQ